MREEHRKPTQDSLLVQFFLYTNQPVVFSHPLSTAQTSQFDIVQPQTHSLREKSSPLWDRPLGRTLNRFTDTTVTQHLVFYLMKTQKRTKLNVIVIKCSFPEHASESVSSHQVWIHNRWDVVEQIDSVSVQLNTEQNLRVVLTEWCIQSTVHMCTYSMYMCMQMQLLDYGWSWFCSMLHC